MTKPAARSMSRVAELPKTAEREFMDDLHAVWRRIGSPPIPALAMRTNQPLARFAFLSDSISSRFPAWMDVQALLRVAMLHEHEVMDHWWPRWEEIQKSRHPDYTLALVPGHSASGLLASALTTQSRDEFVMRLNDLRVALKVSFSQIARQTKKRLPKSTANWMVQQRNFPRHKSQVRDFVRACGVSDEEADLWVQAWTQARQLYSPTSALQAKPENGAANIHHQKHLAERFASQGAYHYAYDHAKSALDIALRRWPEFHELPADKDVGSHTTEASQNSSPLLGHGRIRSSRKI